MKQLFLSLILLVGVWLAGCAKSEQAGSPQVQSSGGEIFVDVAEQSGIDFVHFNGMSGEFYFPEIMGAGAALFDFDNDGDLDVYLVQGTMLGPGKTISDATAKPQGALQGRLYRNDLSGAQLRFSDVTAQSGIVARLYGMGATTGDFDNDGWTDLLLTGLGEVQLWRNNGNGTFSDATKKAGIADADWSVSAAFVDYDRDGALDLFVCNYVNFVIANNKKCYSPTSRLDYCAPRAYLPMPSMLFHNKGNGTFENVSAKSGIAGEVGSALGVVCSDFNEDGWTDIYVANDQRENFLWINQQNGTFKNDALLAGCAVSRDGKPEASMGVDAGDFDADGDEDLFITHLSGEKSTFYYNIGKGTFEDRSFETGIGTASMNSTGFGTLMFDYDNDGWLDILAVNGAVTIIEAQAAAKDPFPFHQSNQLYRNKGDSTFVEVTAQAGAVFKLSEVGRGAAFGDVDNDGDMDVLIANNNGRARLLLNQIGNRQHWAGLKLVDAKSGRDALGAQVRLIRNQKPTLLRRARTDGSYAS
ncbi:MAG: VCBS repeat-containing protein, partial [Acidobacteria bacterium]|nr:VCBS repeat-containing protein [Acidobacteriota bacterium]